MRFSGEVLNAADTAYLGRLLTTRVLERIARMSESDILYGQTDVARDRMRKTQPRDSDSTSLIDMRVSRKKRFVHPSIALVLSGSLSAMIGRTFYSAREGDWLIHPLDVEHREWRRGVNQPYHLFWFQPLMGAKLVETRYSPRDGLGYRIYETHLKPPVDVQKDVEDILASPSQPVDALLVKLLAVVAWWISILRENSGQIAIHDHPIVGKVRSVLDMVEHADGKTLSVSHLAHQIGVSPDYLCRIFHRSTGQTIRQALQKSRVERAKQHLANLSLSIKEIAYLLGFASPQHFTHAFRQRVGLTPRSFRQRIGRDSEA